MKEIIAIVRINASSATKKALIEAGAAGFTAFKVLGRGKLIEDKKSLAPTQTADLMTLVNDEDVKEAEKLIDGFLDGTRLFPRRLFAILAHDDDVKRIVEAIMAANKTNYKYGDGKIFVLPMLDAVRVRTGEHDEDAV